MYCVERDGVGFRVAMRKGKIELRVRCDVRGNADALRSRSSSLAFTYANKIDFRVVDFVELNLAQRRRGIGVHLESTLISITVRVMHFA